MECKAKRNKETEYVSRHSKQKIETRQISPPCACGCLKKIGVENLNIFHSFWDLENYDF